MSSIYDHLADQVMALLPPVIMLWSGTLATIPTGWSLCDGTGGTPDLTDKFIMGAKVANPPGSTGGTQNHNHIVNLGPHIHSIPANANISSAINFHPGTSLAFVLGATDQKNNLPPYYALAYIMKD